MSLLNTYELIGQHLIIRWLTSNLGYTTLIASTPTCDMIYDFEGLVSQIVLYKQLDISVEQCELAQILNGLKWNIFVHFYTSYLLWNQTPF